ncbi:hypothetical protein [Chryseobacterium indoltheticum]|uniref:Uncharacterized protein n=1 Tax=Chryseobacterium indoltheticum TaxID=254 RepID=A0A381FH38_9FLAO|nr:hypothetical protein [Chryseobacterium indoltheticum]SUX45869.1 Uncharacterised protein [Chryseobacterium indoltheticum]
MIFDIYFKRPVVWDYLISLIISGSLVYYFIKDKIYIPKDSDSYSLTGDISNVAFTLAGFILTILTVLITFKDSTGERNDNVFARFFNSSYYQPTVNHLKNCIKSIIVVAMFGFFFKMFVIEQYRNYLFFYNVFALIITFLSIWRCIIILSKILVLQNPANDNQDN